MQPSNINMLHSSHKTLQASARYFVKFPLSIPLLLQFFSFTNSSCCFLKSPIIDCKNNNTLEVMAFKKEVYSSCKLQYLIRISSTEKSCNYIHVKLQWSFSWAFDIATQPLTCHLLFMPLHQADEWMAKPSLFSIQAHLSNFLAHKGPWCLHKKHN